VQQLAWFENAALSFQSKQRLQGEEFHGIVVRVDEKFRKADPKVLELAGLRDEMMDLVAGIGSFERGHRRTCTIYMMPGDERLFVSAAGVGYIIDAKSRTLVETIGTDVAGVMRNEPNTLFVVNHKNRYLEAFGKTGRLWKTERISAGGLHCMALTDDELVGQARHPLRGKWVGFSVSIATGEVRFEGGR
jgi:hypothetical protein